MRCPTLKQLAISILIALSAFSAATAQEARRTILLSPTTPTGAPSSDSFSGNLTGQDKFEKYEPVNNPDPTCMGPTTNFGAGLTEYVAIPVEVTATANLAVHFSATDIADTWIGVYCDFRPNQPGQGLLFFNDDGSLGSLNSEIFASDGVTLEPDTVYWVVVTSFLDSTDLGDGSFTLELTTGEGSFTPVELQSFGID